MGTEGLIYSSRVYGVNIYNSSPNINVRPQNVGIPTVDDIADS